MHRRDVIHSSTPENLSELERAAEHASAARRAPLRLPEPVERMYHEERSIPRRRSLTRTGLVALLAFDLFLVGDYLMAPEMMVRAVVVRLFIVTPIVLLVMLYLQRPVHAMVQDAITTGMCVMGCAAILYLHHGVSTGLAMQAEPGLFVLLLAMNTLLRPDFRIAVAGTLLCYALELAFLRSESMLTAGQVLTSAGRVFWFAVLSLAANYELSREHRLSWLLQARSRKLRRQLAEENRQLVTLSYTDPLTGIANRAAYDERLTELWQRACRAREVLTAVMVDVDHFKSLNDTYGHLYGDRVLQRVASLLQQALRAEGDFVARFGGEEFIVLLPSADTVTGRAVAERIRKLVEVAGAPAVDRSDLSAIPNDNWCTVSCGVASMRPRQNDDVQTLVDAADSALYSAKQDGRNRVHIAADHWVEALI